MIRRETNADSFILITQHDHAVLSGQLAEHFGNARFAKPEPYASTILGTQMHDCGWPLHDDRPTLNRAGLPIDVFESTLPIALKVWTAAAERAAAADPYAGLLVSLHVMALSVFVSSGTMPVSNAKTGDMAAQFEMNKFQHREVERQENLRRRLSLRTDLPLKYGLSQNPIDVGELRLRANFKLLQAMDRLSLAVCCTKPPFAIAQVYPSPDRPAIDLRLERDDAVALVVDPWPFADDLDRLMLAIPCRRIPRRTYSDDAEFHRIYAEAPIQNMEVHVRRSP
jgi:hypothetical protein